MFEQVGKGLSKDSKAQKLAFQHWIEAVSTVLQYFLYVQFFLLLGCLKL